MEQFSMNYLLNDFAVSSTNPKLDIWNIQYTEK
jgi:hypothetical protein